MNRAVGESWFPPFVGPILLAATFVALTWWSWRKWPDILIDFGSQLYIPWQLAAGKSLYLDMDYKDGPFSQYLNALLFNIFGVSLRTLIWANLTFLATLCVLIYRLFARACGHFTATLVVLVLLGVFSFSQYVGIGNYNYVCPYTHEQTHGILLATAMILTLDVAARGRRLAGAFAGACLGALFLTKAELFAPAAFSAVLGLALIAWTSGGRESVRLSAIVLGTALVPIVGMLFFLARHLPWGLALRGIVGNWSHLRGSVLDYKFYRVGMGLDDPLGNAVWSLDLFAGIVVIVIVVAAATWKTRAVTAGRALWTTAVGLALFAALVIWPDVVPWRQLGRPLPWTSTLALCWLLVMYARHRHDRATAAPLLPLILWAALACGLLAKVWLNVRISHYGFVLAMPATLLLVAMAVHTVPMLLERRYGTGTLARACLAGAVLAGVVFFFQWSRAMYATKTLPLGDGGDVILANDPQTDARGYALNVAAEWLRAQMPRDATLLVAPDGLMLNYWLRRSNPTRHIYFVPWSIEYAGGEATVLRELRAHAPDFIALVHRDADELGYGYFGDPGYGHEIIQWIHDTYTRRYRIGAEPLTDRHFGILILERGDRLSTP